MTRILTWVKPSADQMHMGNYFGAVRPFIELGKWDDTEIITLVPDMHAMTTLYDGEAIKKNIQNIVKTYIACGLDLKKTILFKQSDVPAHAQLNWVLSCIASIGYMKRMHAYKDSLQKWKSDELSMWSFNYPILQSADIILYDPDIVPVGKDQKQHVEFARDIAWKFNKLYWDTFKLPKPQIEESVATVPWLDWRKMSKSYGNFLWLFDDEKTLLKKIKSIPTDNTPIEDPKDPDKCNVYNMLRLFLNTQEDQQLRDKYTKWWLSYKDVKMYLYEKIQALVQPIQAKASQISDQDVNDLLKQWAQKANEIASKKIDDVYSKVGFR